jgi:hypothetical protein
VGEGLFRLEPVLNVATAKLGTFEAKRFAANQRDGFRLNFADVPRRMFAVYKLF